MLFCIQFICFLFQKVSKLMWFFSSVLSWVFQSTRETSRKPDGEILLAIQKVEKLLNKKGETFSDVCFAVECAESKDDLLAAFKPFNRIMRIFRIAIQDQEENKVLISALKTLKCSERFTFHMESSSSIQDAIIGYKYSVAKKMEDSFQQRQQLRIFDDAFDKSLLSRNVVSTSDRGQLLSRSPARKRSCSQLMDTGGEYCRNQSNSCLGSTPAKERPWKKKRGSLQNQLTDLLKRQCSAFHDQGCSDACVPQFNMVACTGKKTRWDNGESRQDTKFTSKNLDICLQNQIGKCKRGEKCYFRHEDR